MEIKTYSLDDLINDIFEVSGIKITDGGVNLIETGLGSLHVMRLANKWRKEGSSVTFAKLISEPRLEGWLKLVNIPRKAGKKAGAARQKKVIDRFAPYDMTDVQYSYWIGRKKNQVLGGVGCHAYLEILCNDIDADRLNTAWKKLVLHHPMLHTAYNENGQQQLVKDYEPEDITINDLRHMNEDEAEKKFAEIRDTISHRVFDILHGRNAAVTLTFMPDGRKIMHYDIDLLAADVQSFQKVLDDLALLYSGGELPAVSAEWNFAQYLSENNSRGSEEYLEAEKFWSEKAAEMPGKPELPVKVRPEDIKNVRFNTRRRTVPENEWSNFKKIAESMNITPAMGLLAVYSIILERWSANSKFVINLPIFNRNTGYPGADEAVADFSNILILDFDLTSPRGFAEYAAGIQQNFHESMKHSCYSGVDVVRKLAADNSAESCPAPVVFACNLGYPIISDSVRSNFGELNYMLSQTPQVWIDFQMYDQTDGAVLLKWDSVDEIFPDGVLDRMFDAYLEYLSRLAADPAEWSKVPVVSGADAENRRLAEMHVEEKDIPEKNLIAGFIENADRTPEAAALINCVTGEKITYQQLYGMARNIAAELVNSGMEPEERVAVTLPKGNLQIAAVLGVHMAGGCYVPVGVKQPAERQRKIFNTAGIRFAIVGSDTADGGQYEGITRICAENAASAEAAGFKPVLSSPDSEAYIIFTSGSTGEPKGVVIQHKCAYNTIADINSRCNVGNGDSILAVSALDFDLSVYDIFGMLNAGGTIITIDEASKRDSEKWLEAVSEYSITMWNSVPAILDMLLVSADMKCRELTSLHRVFLSGDWIGLDIPAKLKNAAPASELTSMGGATEASIWSNWYDVTLPLDSEWNSIPYGMPLTNQKYNILDDNLRGCPEWVTGELVIGGKGLAKEYCNDPVQTDAHFFTDENGERWYRTGDLGRFRENGIIEFLGRKDFQVKVRGHRIELGEIETALKGCPTARNSAVDTYRDKNGTNHLVSFIVPAADELLTPEEKETLKADIRTYLASAVPDYMIPEICIFCDELPLTANGKVDRKKLRSFDIESELAAGKVYIAPSNETESRLMEIWKDTLGISEISCDDDFFDLGGDSLSAVRLNNAIRETFGTDFHLNDIFDIPVLSDQADFILGSGKVTDDAKVTAEHDESARYEPFPLTNVQKAYLMGEKNIYEYGGISTHYYFEIRVPGLDTERFERAVNRVIDSQDMLHCVFSDDGSTQRVLKDYPRYVVRVYDVSEADENNTILSVREEMEHKLFNSSELPLFDIRVIRGAETSQVNFCFDNIIFDGYSIFLFFSCVTKAYKDESTAPAVPAISFRDYVMSLGDIRNGSRYEKSRKYWTDRIDDMPLAPDLPVVPMSDTMNNRFTHLEYILDAASWKKLKDKISAIGGITPTGFLIALYSEVLCRWSKNKRFTVNLTHFNREKIHDDIDSVIGDFTSLTMLESDVSGYPTFRERCRALQQQLWNDLDNASYDGVEVERELIKRNSITGPAFPYVFTSALGLNAEGSMFTDRMYSSSETPQVWLDHQVSEENGTLVLVWDHLKERFPEGMINELCTAYTDTLERLVEDDSLWDAERHSIVEYSYPEIVRSANDTRTSLPEHMLHSKVLESYRNFPEKTAVVDENGRYTYSDIVLRASDIADKLRANGVKEGECVAVMLPKSVYQVYAVLGILGAGCVYVPVDTGSDTERKSFIIKNAGIRNIVMLSENSESYEGCSAIYADKAEKAAECTLSENGGKDSAAYIIHTSGSTGVPKGVIISHAGAVNTIEDINRRYGITSADTAIGLSQLYFDLSVYDIFGLLSVGGTLVYPGAERYMDPSYWHELIRENGITVWNSVPAFMKMFVDYIGLNGAEYPPLKAVMLSGDWIPLDLFPKIKEMSPETKCISLGGATEASIWSIYYDYNGLDPSWKSIPYGKALANQEFYVMDSAMDICPVMAEGELYIGGDGLASGYLNAPEENAAHFITDAKTGKRYYRTGDLGRMMPDGNIEFLGRADTQVKILGFRIELGEIDSVISKFEGVRNSVTAAIEVNGSAKKLYTCVETSEIRPDDEEKLREELRNKLPKYMIPAKIVFTDAMPLTSNGKIDRRTIIAELEKAASAETETEAPADMTETEKIIAEIMAEALGTASVSPDDDFYDLGADSLIMGNAASKVRNRFEEKVPFYEILTVMLNDPNVRSVAELIEPYLSEE